VILAEDVKRMRDETGKGLVECRAILVKRERLAKLRALGKRAEYPTTSEVRGIVRDLIGLLIEQEGEEP